MNTRYFEQQNVGAPDTEAEDYDQYWANDSEVDPDQAYEEFLEIDCNYDRREDLENSYF